VPSWFVDHLACAPLQQWLPDALAEHRVAIVEAVTLPRSLSGWLGAAPRLGEGVPAEVIVHVGALHVAPQLDEEELATSGAEAVVDLARVDGTAGWWWLRPWRLAPVRRDAVARVAWLGGLGLRSPQQWVCRDPFAMVVTIAERRPGTLARAPGVRRDAALGVATRS
jgi:hypothetical protein